MLEAIFSKGEAVQSPFNFTEKNNGSRLLFCIISSDSFRGRWAPLLKLLGIAGNSQPYKNRKHLAHQNRNHLHSPKLIWQWIISIFNRNYIFKWWIFRCHVSFQGCNENRITQNLQRRNMHKQQTANKHCELYNIHTKQQFILNHYPGIKTSEATSPFNSQPVINPFCFVVANPRCASVEPLTMTLLLAKYAERR